MQTFSCSNTVHVGLGMLWVKTEIADRLQKCHITQIPEKLSNRAILGQQGDV